MPEVLRKIVGVFEFKDKASKDVEKVNDSMDAGTESAMSMQDALVALGGAAVIAALTALASASLEAYTALEEQQVRLKNLADKHYPELKASMDEAIAASQGLTAEGDMSEAINSASKYGASVDLLKGTMGNMQKLAAIAGDDLSSVMQGMAQDVNTGSTRFLKQNAILSKHIDEFRKLGSGYDEATKKKRELFIVSVMQKEQLKIQQQYNATMETTAAMLKVSESQWGNVKERIGEVVAIAFKPLLKIANQVLRFLGETEEGLVMLKLAISVLIPVIGVALVFALKAAAVAAWAFIAPFLPFIAIGIGVIALITAIILVVQDLITFFQGGESVIGDVIENIKQWFYGLLESVGEIVDGIIAFFANIPKAIGKFISDATEWLKSTTVGSMILDLVSTLIPGVEARQMGGPVEAGQSYLVGEEGPELFTPDESGMITPNGAISETSGTEGTAKGGSIMYKIDSLIGTLTINVEGAEEAGTAVQDAILDALNELSRNVFRAESGLQVT